MNRRGFLTMLGATVSAMVLAYKAPPEWKARWWVVAHKPDVVHWTPVIVVDPYLTDSEAWYLLPVDNR